MEKERRKLKSEDNLPMSTAKKIKLMITKRGMKPGDRLPTENELSVLFGVSRSTLREAMKFLRAENVVVIRQGSGTFVSDSMGIGEDPLGLHFANQEMLLQNLFEARLLIEPQITELAAMRATSQEIHYLERLAADMNKLRINSDEAAQMDVRFHTAVAECTHNDVLARIVPIINESIQRGHFKTHDNQESFQRAKRSHLGIYNAIASGDHMEARFLAERHVRETLDDIKKKEDGK